MADHDTRMVPARFMVLDEHEDRAVVCSSLPDDDVVRQANKHLSPGGRWGLRDSGTEACDRWPDSHRHLLLWR